MRYLLVILAAVGLMLSPAAASAAAMRCMHEHGGMAMVMEASPVAADVKVAAHDCDENLKSPDHDSSACAQDCIVMGGVSAALSDTPGFEVIGVDGHMLVPQAAKTIRSFAPPGLKRPPRTNS